MKLAISTTVALVLGAGAISGQAAAANDGVIEFTGNISDVTCTVEGQDPGEGAVLKDVDLKSVSASRLTEAGNRANHTGFTIQVGGAGDTACTNGRTAYVSFDPTSPAIDVATGRLNADAGDGAATNVQIEVTQKDGTPINVYTEKSEGVVIANNTALIPLAAQFYATGAATEGTVDSRVGFMVVYD